MGIKLSAEQIAAWERNSPETVIGNPAAHIGRTEARDDALEALEDIMTTDNN